jgi:hypothetical protein
MVSATGLARNPAGVALALDAALADNYPEFLRIRAKHLQAKAEQLAGQDVKETAEAEEIEDSDVDPTD